MKNERKMDKFCQYGWKNVEMDENMIDECMNPQYWWTHSIDEPTVLMNPQYWWIHNIDESTVLMNPQYMLYSVY
jgi:hypothetical protein